MSNSNQDRIIFTDLPKEPENTSPETQDEVNTLAIIGAQVLALKAWQHPNMSGHDLNERLDSIILDHDIDIEDTREIRKICNEFGVDTTAYGDEAPTLHFRNKIPSIYRERITELFERRHNILRLDGDQQDLNEIHQELIEHLTASAGIEIN